MIDNSADYANDTFDIHKTQATVLQRLRSKCQTIDEKYSLMNFDICNAVLNAKYIYFDVFMHTTIYSLFF